MTKFATNDLMDVLEGKNGFFEVVEHRTDCAYCTAIIRDKNTDKYYGVDYMTLSYRPEKYILGNGAFKEIKEVKRNVEVTTITRNGEIISQTEKITFELID